MATYEKCLCYANGKPIGRQERNEDRNRAWDCTGHHKLEVEPSIRGHNPEKFPEMGNMETAPGAAFTWGSSELCSSSRCLPKDLNLCLAQG